MENIATCPYIKHIRKELNSKHFWKRMIYFPILKATIFFWAIRVFTSLGVAIFRVTLCDCALTFLKKATIYENDMTQFAFIFPTQIKYEEWKECDMKKYLLFCVTFVTVQIKIKQKLITWKSDRTNLFVDN